MSQKHHKRSKLIQPTVITASDPVVSIFSFRQWLRFNRHIFYLLLGLVAVTYGWTLGHSFLSDDIYGIVNENLANFSLVFQNPIQSVRPFMYFVINAFFGKEPWAFRLPNIISHGLVVLTVFALIDHLIDRFTAIVTAALTAVHPLMAESVTWISAGGHTSYTLFSLLSFLFYLLAKQSKKLYWLSLGSFIFSILISEKAIMLPGIIVVYEFLYSDIRRYWKYLLPYVLVCIVFLFSFTNLAGMRASKLSNEFNSPKGSISLFQSVPVAVTTYLNLIVWPAGLTLYHSETTISAGEYALRYFTFVSLVLGLLYGLWKFREIDSSYKHIVFGGIFYLIALSPSLAAVNYAWLVAERYAYLSAVGIFIIAAVFIDILRRKLGRLDEAVLLAGVIVFVLTVRTILRNFDWQDQDHLWLAAARTSPNSAQNNLNLGDLYGRQNDVNKAIYYFDRATKLHVCYGDAYHNLASAYVEAGMLDLAITNYGNALKCKPILWQSHFGLARLYASKGDYAKALEEIDKALSINPNDQDLRKFRDLIQSFR